MDIFGAWVLLALAWLKPTLPKMKEEVSRISRSPGLQEYNDCD